MVGEELVEVAVGGKTVKLPLMKYEILDVVDDDYDAKIFVDSGSMYPSGEAPPFRNPCRGPVGCAGQRH